MNPFDSMSMCFFIEELMIYLWSILQDMNDIFL